MLIALAAAALVAGLAGAWSPCGFSMVDTLGPHGYARRMRITVLACLTFALGALAGGAATFGGLALLGAALGAGQGAAAAIAVALLLAAAAGDIAGRRIVPQVRRQVPESWRRVLPLPLAAGLYGVLLGLGFTTFVLSFAVYALAAACLALGDPQAGLTVGLAFAAGRILPVVVLAPLQQTERGIDIAAGMAERPAVLRAIRAVGAVALGVAALLLALAGVPASAAAPSVLTFDGTDPSTVAGSIAWQVPSGSFGLVQHGAQQPQPLPGTDPALSPDAIVWRQGEALVVADRFTLHVRLRLPAPGAEEPAISVRWLTWRAREANGDVLRAIDLQAPDQPPVDLRRVVAPDRIGRPSIDGDRVMFHVARRSASQIEEIYLPTRRRTTLRTGRDGAQLLNPAEDGGQLLYIRSAPERQQVLIGPRRARSGNRDRSLLTMHPTVRRDAGHERGRERHDEGYPRGRAPRLPERAPAGVTVTLWSTALAHDAAYVSRIRRTASSASSVIVRLPR
ncbi:MAG TPA: hypothetical protein VNA28_16595 [Solirubrobacteraceae bacterium]|nr:hypothetical protein [Solirubrobacteraceae bacterium]